MVGPVLVLALLGACRNDGLIGDPGRVTVHRLNRAEYNNTVRDLLLTDQRPADDFPADDFGYGFDNMADTLSVSPLHVELYEAAAFRLADEVAGGVQVAGSTWHVEGEDMTATAGGLTGGAWLLWSQGEVVASHVFEAGGRYQFMVSAWQDAAGSDPAHMVLLVDGVEVGAFDVTATSGSAGLYTAEIELEAGNRQIGVGFTNDFYQEEAGLDRNLYVDFVELIGPLDSVTGPGFAKIFSCTPKSGQEKACAEEILGGFAKRAWRRPTRAGEVEALLGFYEQGVDLGAPFEEAVGYGIAAALVSSSFLYRIELDEDPTSSKARALDAFELASRLSYFLWSSMPDDELFAAAEDGSLVEDDVLEAQVRRMLADPKAEALVDNLGGQWLYTRAVDDAFPDVNTWPDWNEGMRASMKAELRSFVGSILLEDRSMLEVLTAEDTVVDPVLADLYGIAHPGGEGFVDVSVGAERQGILGKAGLLMALSYPTRTSPVRRGKWVLGNLMCEAPAPPPPDVNAVIVVSDTAEPENPRAQLEAHTTDPVCASCHHTMDPIGFGLENFDGIGVWRDDYPDGDAIDASGSLPGKGKFEGLPELVEKLVGDEKLPKCMAEKTFTYALGRAPDPQDLDDLDAINAAFVAGGHRFAELAVAITTSPAFRYRRGEPEEK